MDGWNQPDSVAYSGYVQQSNSPLLPASFLGNVAEGTNDTSSVYYNYSKSLSHNGAPNYQMNNVTFDNTYISQYYPTQAHSGIDIVQPEKAATEDPNGEISKIQKLPEELMKMFKPKFCDLCMAKMNSSVQMEMHYKGKQHFKKQHQWLVAYNISHGLPPPKKVKLASTAKPVDLSMAGKVGPIPESKERTLENPEMYCKICDLTFTSFEHADQHYKGRNHQRMCEGKAPYKAGYFNKFTNKWQRNPPEETHPKYYHKLKAKLEKRKRKNDDAPGSEPEQSLQPPKKIAKTSKTPDLMSLIKVEYEVDLTKLPKGPSSDVSIKEELPKSVDVPLSKFHCSVCQVTLNSKVQLNIHNDSKRHRNNTKKS